MAGYIRPQINWRAIDTENVTHVTGERDLPGSVGSTHTLENRVYKVDGFVTITGNLDISNTPVLVGNHGGADGFIYTGAGDMITGTNGGFFARDLTFDAPGGTMFNISGDQTTEMLVESCNFADPANLGNLNSLGTIEGYRVPSFKGCNFEDFDTGLTFTGTPDKVFFSESPFRGVTESNVTILTFDSNLDTDIVDITDCYVKSVQSDTEVIRVETGALPSEIFQYRGTTHDTSVTKSNILNGEVGEGEVGTKTLGCFPLRDSTVGGALGLETTGTVTGSGAGATRIGSANVTTITENLERLSESAEGQLQYDARFDESVTVSATAGGLGANTTFSIYIAKNGSIIQASRARGLLSNASDAETLSTGAKVELTTGDTVSAFIENDGGSTDLDVGSYTLVV